MLHDRKVYIPNAAYLTTGTVDPVIPNQTTNA